MYSRTLSRPLRDTGAAARRFAAGDLTHKLAVRGRGELADLANSLDRMAAELRRSREMLLRAQDIARLGSREWDPARRHFNLSEQVHACLGVVPGRFVASERRVLRKVDPGDRASLEPLLASRPDGPMQFEPRALRRDGRWRRVAIQGEPRHDSSGQARGAVGTVQDVPEQRAAEERLASMVNLDTLTGLANRYLFWDRLAHAMAQSDRHGQRVALLFMDLDRFESVNDALGQGVGDQLLREVGLRLEGALREGGTVARLGGDEFTVILEGLHGAGDAAQVAQRLLDALSKPFVIERHGTFVAASIGITWCPAGAANVDTLLENADAALYRAKDKGRGSYQFCTEALNVRAEQRLAMERRLRGAIDRGELLLHWQPIVALRDGRLVGAEALPRWRDGRRVDPPQESVPVLEETGLIVPAGC